MARLCRNLYLQLQNEADLSPQFWLDALQFECLWRSGVSRGYSLLPDSRHVAQHLDILQQSVCDDFRWMKSQELQALVDRDRLGVDIERDAFMQLKLELDSKLDENSKGFSWALWCFYSLDPAAFRKLLQKELLTPIHIVFAEFLPEPCMPEISREMDAICEAIFDHMELRFFYSMAKMERRTALEAWDSEPYSCRRSEFRRLRERSLGSAKWSQPWAPLSWVLSASMSMMLHAVAFACISEFV